MGNFLLYIYVKSCYFLEDEFTHKPHRPEQKLLRLALGSLSLSPKGSMIGAEDVRMVLRETPADPLPATIAPGQTKTAKSETVSLRETLNKIEKDLILDALRKAGGVQVEAAGMLGLTQKNLWKKIQKHSIKLALLKGSGPEKDI